MRNLLQRHFDWIALNDRTYEFLFERMGTDEVVSIDCETTGLNPKKDDIVSIAAVKIRRHCILASQAYRVTVNPEVAIPASSIKIHQIRKQDVEIERPIRKVLPDLLRFIGNRPLVGYYIDFDVRMLNKDLFAMLNIGLQNPTFDVCDLYYDRKYGKAPPGTQIDLRFATLLDDLGIPPRQAHDAFNDAMSAAEAYIILTDLKARGVYLKRTQRAGPLHAPVG
jgi:DNA polymerase III subunit epsilon